MATKAIELELTNLELINPAPKNLGFNATLEVGESTLLRVKPFGGKSDATDATAFFRHTIGKKSEGCMTSVSYLLEKGLATKKGNKIVCAPFKCQWINGEIID